MRPAAREATTPRCCALVERGTVPEVTTGEYP